MPEEVKKPEEVKQPEAPKKGTGLEQNVAGALAYLAGLITGIIFILVEKENKFVRFHAMQSIIWSLTLFVAGIVLGFIPIIGWILAALLPIVVLVSWLFLMYKAYKNEYYKLPFLGDLAEKYSSKV